MANRHSRRGPERVKISEAKKEFWFRRGAHALAAAFPTTAGKGYACPICVRAARDPQVFTVEDVPPRRVGGRPSVLTCADCNSQGGHELDVHWGHLTDVEGFIRGELQQAVTADLRIGDHRTTVELMSIEGTVTARVVGAASAPAAMEGQQASLLQSAEMHVSFNRSRFSEPRARIAVLRAAYLMAFGVCGYRFMRRWARVRQQFLALHTIDTALLGLVQYQPHLPRDRRQLAFIYEPSAHKALYVGFGRWTALIPFIDDSPLYERSPDGGWNFTAAGYEWPTEPTFGLPHDWDTQSTV
jgi:hypothetical protein